MIRACPIACLPVCMLAIQIDLYRLVFYIYFFLCRKSTIESPFGVESLVANDDECVCILSLLGNNSRNFRSKVCSVHTMCTHGTWSYMAAMRSTLCLPFGLNEAELYRTLCMSLTLWVHLYDLYFRFGFFFVFISISPLFFWR